MSLRSKFFDDVSRELPLPEYPRPQFRREAWQNLNGVWQLAITDRNSAFPDDYDLEILVPFAVETELSGVNRKVTPDDRLWYRRTFKVSDELKGENKRIILQFGAVDYFCRVFVNREPVGEHRGGYSPFHLDITDALKDDENELIVYVEDPSDKGPQQRGKQVIESHGFWYTATSGIWQTVWLESYYRPHVRFIKMLPDTDRSELILNSRITHSAEGCELRAVITLENETVFDDKIDKNAVIGMPDFKYWSPEDPVLYDLMIELIDPDGTVLDRVFSYFGMRKFSIGSDEKGLSRLCLNDKPYFQRGLLDQGYFPDSGLTPPCDEAMIYDISKMKELGFNMLRKHIKLDTARWYYHCDRLGMLVWQDMVSGGEYIGTMTAGVLPLVHAKIKDDDYKRFSREKLEWREEFRTQLKEMVDALYNCVGLCCWVPFNEGWGQFDALDAANWLKSYDPSRFVDHASGWYDQGGPDMLSMHRYILPIRLPKLDTRPFVISEYGGYSQNIEGHVWNYKKSFGYIQYKSKKALSSAYEKLHLKQVVPLITKGLCATVYTQVSDVEFEVNGILTYDRKIVKIDEDTVKRVNSLLTY